MIHAFFLLFTFILLSGTAHAADLYTFTDEEGATYYTNVPGDNRMKAPVPVVKKEAFSQPPFAPSLIAEPYESIITSASKRFDVDPNLVRAVIRAESNFNPRAVSPKGALGLMQLMPLKAKEMAVTNPFNPEENIHAGVRYLGELLSLLKGNLSLALAAYNAGPNRVKIQNKIPAIEETQNYVQRVIKYYKDLKGKQKI